MENGKWKMEKDYKTRSLSRKKGREDGAHSINPSRPSIPRAERV
jgi:hypothetical protein